MNGSRPPFEGGLPRLRGSRTLPCLLQWGVCRDTLPRLRAAPLHSETGISPGTGVNALRFDAENRATPVSGFRAAPTCMTAKIGGCSVRTARRPGSMTIGIRYRWATTRERYRDYIFFADQMVAFVGIASGNTYYCGFRGSRSGFRVDRSPYVNNVLNNVQGYCQSPE
jgi:hypothetical protein